MKFEPTNEQIDLAQDLVIAMAFRDLAKESFEKWEAIILNEGNFRIDEKYRQEVNLRRRMLPENEVIKNPGDLCFMAGINDYGTPLYEGSDAQLYYDILRKISLEHGFIHGENALSRAEHEVVKAATALIEGTRSIHPIDPQKLTLLKHRQQLIELLLKLFAPFVPNDQLAPKQAQYFSERHTQPIA